MDAMSAAGMEATKGRFSVRTVAALIAVGVFSLSALTVLSAYAPELRKGDDGGAHALSRSAVGFAGAAALLKNLGWPVLLSRGPLHANDEALLILTPGPQHSLAALDDVRHDGTRLVVLPKWGTAPLPMHKGWVQSVGLIPTQAVVRPLAYQPGDREGDEALEASEPPIVSRRPGATHPRLMRPNGEPIGTPGVVNDLQTVAGPGWIPVVVDETGAAVLAMNAETHLYVLADPDLLNTHGLRQPQEAAIAVRMLDLIRPGGGAVIFDLTLPGFSRPRSILRLMLEPPLLGVTLALLAAAALVAYQAAVRFGPGRSQGRAIALGKRALADNSAGLIRLAKREHRMAEPYAQLVRAGVARAIGAPRNLEGEALDAFLDRMGARLGVNTGYTALAAEARAAKSPGDLVRVARNLHRWKLEMTRGRQ
jgi:hypothetical protein